MVFQGGVTWEQVVGVKVGVGDRVVDEEGEATSTSATAGAIASEKGVARDRTGSGFVDGS